VHSVLSSAGGPSEAKRPRRGGGAATCAGKIACGGTVPGLAVGGNCFLLTDPLDELMPSKKKATQMPSDRIDAASETGDLTRRAIPTAELQLYILGEGSACETSPASPPSGLRAPPTLRRWYDSPPHDSWEEDLQFSSLASRLTGEVRRWHHHPHPPPYTYPNFDNISMHSPAPSSQLLTSLPFAPNSHLTVRLNAAQAWVLRLPDPSKARECRHGAIRQW
jgi:hypothetical protein